MRRRGRFSISIKEPLRLDNFDNLVFDSLKGALARVRFAVLTSLILSAVVFANVYLQALSFDKALERSAYHRIANLQENLSKIEEKYKCTAQHIADNRCDLYQSIMSYTKWEPEHKIERSGLEIRIARAQNMLKDNKITSAEIPTFGLPVSVNDLNVFCGSVLLIMGLWAFFNMQQVHAIIVDPSLRGIVKPYSSLIIHMFSISNPNNANSVAAYIYLIAFLPGSSLFVAGVYDGYTLRENILPQLQGYDEKWLWLPVILELTFAFVASYLAHVTLEMLFAINKGLRGYARRVR